MRGSRKSKSKRRCDTSLMRRVDIYGIPIEMNFEDQSRYKTNFGAIMSIITAFVMIVFGGYKFIELVTSQNTAIKIYPQILDLLKVGEGEEGRIHP